MTPEEKSVIEHPDIGKRPDHVIAFDLGIAKSTVYKYRSRHGIPSAAEAKRKRRKEKIKQLSEYENLFSETAEFIMEAFGVTKHDVCKARTKKKKSASPEELEQIKKTESELRSVSAVMGNERRRHGTPRYVIMKDPRLFKDSLTELSEKHEVHYMTIKRAREEFTKNAMKLWRRPDGMAEVVDKIRHKTVRNRIATAYPGI